MSQIFLILRRIQLDSIINTGPGVDTASNRNEYQEDLLGVKSGRCLRLTNLPPSWAISTQSGNLNFLEPSGHLGPVTGLIYLLRLLSKVQTGLHTKCPLFLSGGSNGNWIFSTVFWKILKHRIYIKSIEWEQRRCVRTDGQTDRIQVIIVAFSNFANAL